MIGKKAREEKNERERGLEVQLLLKQVVGGGVGDVKARKNGRKWRIKKKISPGKKGWGGQKQKGQKGKEKKKSGPRKCEK